MEYVNIETTAATESLAAFTCEPAAIEAAAKFLAKRIVPRRNLGAPCADWLHIEASPAGAVTLSAFNSDQGASVTVPAHVETPGAFCAEAEALADVLAKLRKDKGREIAFADGERITVKSGRGRFTLRRHPTADFPMRWALPVKPGAVSFEIGAGQLLADLSALDVCASREEHRPYLRGVALQVNRMAGQDRLTFAATDGFAMAVASRPLPAGAEALPDSIIPSAAIAALHGARKLAGLADVARVTVTPTGEDASSFLFDLGAVKVWSQSAEGAFPDWQRPQVWVDVLTPTGGQAALFPDLLPGARTDVLDKIGKAVGRSIDWEPCAKGLLGTVQGDDGLVFGVIETDAARCTRHGFDWSAGSEIIGPDGVTYPVAMSETAIHLSKEQVRALIGESCFETMAITMPDGRVVHILQWLWDDGASRFLTVRPDGRCYGPKDAGCGEYLTKAEIEAALAGETAPDIAGTPTPDAAPIICSGPMCKGEPWPEIMATMEAGCSYIGLESIDGAVSLVNLMSPERHGKQRTRIPARHQEQARALFDRQLARDIAEIVAAPTVEMRSEAGKVYQVNRGAFGTSIFHNPGDVDGYAQPAVVVGEPMHGRSDADIAEIIAAHAAQEPQERAEALPAPQAHPEPEIALSGREAGEGEAFDPDGSKWRHARMSGSSARMRYREGQAAWEAGKAATDQEAEGQESADPPAETAPESNAGQMGEADPVAALLARVEALEARVEALPAELRNPPAIMQEAMQHPIADAARPKRAPAHERAIRQAWQHRRESRIRRGAAEAQMQMRETLQEELRRASRESENLRTQLQGTQELLDAMHDNYRALSEMLDGVTGKRRASAQRAHRMIQAGRVATRGAQDRLQMAQAELARLKRDMADPMQPERASDIARLIRERDEARIAAAATDARNRALKSAVDELADRFEAMVSRVSRAEAAMRAAGLEVAA